MKNLIKKKLQVRKKSYSWLARKTGLSKVYICRLINNPKSCPTIRTAVKIAKALDSTIEKVWILD